MVFMVQYRMNVLLRWCEGEPFEDGRTTLETIGIGLECLDMEGGHHPEHALNMVDSDLPKGKTPVTATDGTAFCSSPARSTAMRLSLRGTLAGRDVCLNRINGADVVGSG